MISVPVAGDSTSKAAEDAVKTLRNDAIPAAFDGTDANVYVTGATAMNLDFIDITETYLPIVFALVLGLSFILLLVAFRSVVVPLTSIAMNLLSVGAAYGLLVFVTQEGHGAGLFGFHVVPTIEAWIPLFLFSVLFGLSMDYQVFLLSRIRERYDHTGNTREAVAYGIGSTAHLITGAALIMVAVFAGFASGDLVMFQQMGFGLGVAILVDATIVRVVLMPAVMELLGDRNWYLPRWLEWLPDLRVEGEPEQPPVGGRPGARRGGIVTTTSRSPGPQPVTTPAAPPPSACSRGGRLPWAWPIAILVGFPIGGLVANLVVGKIDTVAAAVAGGLIAGGIIGAAQWLALRPLVPWLWVVATSVGMAVGLAAGAALVDYGIGRGDLALMGAITGLGVGGSKRSSLPDESRCAVVGSAESAGLGTGLAVTSFVITSNVKEHFTNFGASGALVFALLTWLLLRFLFRTRPTAGRHRA